MKTHNIGYYQKLWGKYEQFQQNNRARQEKACYLYPDYLLINPVARFATEMLITPTKWAYSTAGKAVVNLTNHFDPKLALKVDDAWHDPMSTETMLKIGTWIQSTAKINAVRKTPSSFPVLHFLDTALISFSRHVYVVAKDLNAFLKIPNELRKILNLEESTSEDTPESLAGKTWHSIKNGVVQLKNALYLVVEKICAIVGISLKGTWVEKGLKKIGKDLVHNALGVGERKIRHQIVAKVAEKTARQTMQFLIGSGLKIAVGWGSYLLAKHAFIQVTGAHDFPPEVVKLSSLALKTGGAYLWIRCMTPTLHSLYEDYEGDFDPDAKTFVELSNLLDRKHFLPALQVIKKTIW